MRFCCGKIILDKTIVRWYGLGGAFHNVGLPMYVDLDRKPDSGCEVQDAACVTSRIMIQIKVVDRAEEEHRKEKESNLPASYTGLKHGTKITLKLLKPWNKTGRRAIVDSYFASDEFFSCVGHFGVNLKNS